MITKERLRLKGEYMNKLIIDCSAGMSVYVVKENNVFSYVDLDMKKHTDNLLVKVDEILKEANLSVSEIDCFCVCIGPGSFTGIRVAISIIKGLCINTNAKICVASNFDIYKVNTNENYALVLEGFSNNNYVRFKIENVITEECLAISEFNDKIKQNNNILNIYAQNEKVQSTLRNFEINSKIADIDIILCFDELIKNNKFIEINKITPIYLRASQAEIEREKRLNK